MAVRAVAMSSDYSSQPPERSHLFRKVVLVSLLAAALALGLAILFREKPSYPVWFQSGFAAASLGLVTGFGARFTLSRRNWFIRLLAAMTAFLIGLYVLGFATNWKYGIGPLVFWPKQVDWDGLIQIGIGFFLFLIVLTAWRHRPLQVAEIAPAPQPVARPKAQRKPRGKSKSREIPKISLSNLPKVNWSGFLKPVQQSIRVRRSSSKHKKGAVRTISAEDLPVRPQRRSLMHGKAKVQLAVVEEHRCPYCLEPVSRTDPRGVVECEVCHALHHKDCWEITGICQVPHYNS